jgi:hypothetical protein
MTTTQTKEKEKLDLFDARKNVEIHSKAAKNHTEAAKHHTDAAKHFEAGNTDKALASVGKANDAYKMASEAHQPATKPTTKPAAKAASKK